LPENGAANAALMALLAKALKLPKSSLVLDSGGKGRVKSVRAAGEVLALRAALGRLVASLPSVG
jgi:uncharacterized protein YggU (UPF0235/DUF167 family)